MKKTTKKSVTRKTKIVKELPIVKSETELLFKNKVADIQKLNESLVNDLGILTKHFHELVKQHALKYGTNLNTQIFFEVV